ncbi:SDR family NAD(P)-dependent oxidoreductase [uncultured Mycobacterium sp.]|uniref:SDR family NAD(P)-dependent oxidoreductase n=1 Tax=uncultured Mycobacterium sp. TaxID=171292 RepID=UPI0035CA8C33
MTITLITGGNKGLGYETARRLIAEGHQVYLGARNPERGQRAADDLGAQFVELDVTDDASVARAADELMRQTGALDILINNAGIVGPHTSVADLTGLDAQDVFNTNVFSIVRTTHAFLPLLNKSDATVIVNVSSGLGSFALVHDQSRIESSVPGALYQASKSAVLMLTVQYARQLPNIRINAVDPGYTATDLNGHSGTQTVTEGTDAIVAMATIAADGPTGTFTDRHGTVPW